MNPVSWVRLLWAEWRLQKYPDSVHRIQAEDLQQRTRRHVHDVSDAIFAAQDVASKLESILQDMKGDRHDEPGTE